MDLITSLLIYGFRLLAFFIITIIATIASFIPFNKTKNWHYKLYRIWSLAFFRAFGIKEHIHYKNLKSLPNQYILISNHLSGIDVIWLPARFNVIPLSKDDIKYSPVVGNITRAAGVIFVNRQESGSRNVSLIACMREIQRGNSLLIFPEGGCYGKELHPFMSGAFELAFKTKLPLLPVYIHYEEEDTYEWGNIAPGPYIKRLLFKAKNRNGHLYIFDAINSREFEDAEQLKEHTFSFYKKLEQEYTK